MADGISIDRAYWGLGIGRALVEASVECARRAGYAQLEKLDMHPKKVTVLKVTGVELVTFFKLRFSCNTAYLFYCNRLSNRIYNAFALTIR